LTRDQYLLSCIERKPDIYLDELRTALQDGMGIVVSISTIYRHIRLAGYTMKMVCSSAIPETLQLTHAQITKAARERDAWKRAEFIARISKYHPHERLYVDESRFDRRNATRKKAWAYEGERALRKVFFLRGKRYVLVNSP